MPESPDLYRVLGVSPAATADQIRKAYSWYMSVERSATRRSEVARAFSVLGDPRLRAEYDRGQTVGVGPAQFFARPMAVGARRPRRGLIRRAESRWEARTQDLCPPTRRSRQFAVIALLLMFGVPLVAATYGRISGESTAEASGARPVAGPLQLAAPISRPMFESGTCLTGENNTVHPSQRVGCAVPHRAEVIKVVDLARLIGQSSARSAEPGADVCTAEFRAFTGLAGPVEDLWPFWLTESVAGSPTGVTCFVVSRYPRVGSAARIAQ